MKNIILIGLPGSGKTTVGKRVAQALDRPFTDTDERIVTAQGKSISEIFATEGEATFRAYEREAVAAACTQSGAVIAVGGGAVSDGENVRQMKKSGMVFFLDRSADEILRSVDLSDRPLLQKDPQALQTLSAQRNRLYRKAADCILTGGTVSELAEAIETMYEMTGEGDE